jgi:hypothetical protein
VGWPAVVVGAATGAGTPGAGTFVTGAVVAAAGRLVTGAVVAAAGRLVTGAVVTPAGALVTGAVVTPAGALGTGAVVVGAGAELMIVVTGGGPASERTSLATATAIATIARAEATRMTPAISRQRRGVGARRVRAGAPHSRHQICSAASGAPQKGQLGATGAAVTRPGAPAA